MSSEEIQVTEKNRAGKGHPDDAALQEKRRLAGEIIERLEKRVSGCPGVLWVMMMHGSCS